MIRAVHPFPARMAPEVALAVVGHSERALRVLDPMCGSGTVLSLGVRHGHHVTGYDLDPLAVLMARVATQEVNTSILGTLAEECLGVAGRARLTDVNWADAETREFARYWFGDAQRVQLVRLSRALNRLDLSPERDALQVALSRLIVTKSPRASLAADTSHSRPHRVITASDYDVYGGFKASVQALTSILGARKLTGTATIKRGDARDKQLFVPATFDLVITSPPYLNAIDYMRGHRLALIWLGYTLSELRTIRGVSIGSESARRGRPTEAHDQLVRRVVANATDLDAPIQRLIEKYAHDMLELAENIRECLVTGGRAIVVVADSVLRGRRIPTGQIVQTALVDKGLTLDSVQSRGIPASLRYLPVSKAGDQLSKRMKNEYIIKAARTS